jgi:hypothetical protein
MLIAQRTPTRKQVIDLLGPGPLKAELLVRESLQSRIIPVYMPQISVVKNLALFVQCKSPTDFSQAAVCRSRVFSHVCKELSNEKGGIGSVCMRLVRIV